MHRTFFTSPFLTSRARSRVLIAALVTLIAFFGGVPQARAAGCAGGSALVRVPADCDLQTAIDRVGDDGVIEVAAGTYYSPNAVIGGYGFRINMEGKGFTIRGIGDVYLDGGGSRDILQIQNISRSDGKLVTFENLTFRNGFAGGDGLAGAVTIMNGDAAFIDCTFTNNVGAQSSTGGGALLLGASVVDISGSTFTNNTAKTEGGAISAKSGSYLTIGDSTFRGNRVDVPNHRLTSSGGAVHIGDSFLSVSDSTFENNRAGYVGGAVFVIGSWTGDVSMPHAGASIWNSTFRGNAAQRDASVSWNIPTEGGAVHAEDQSQMTIRYSHFENNNAGVGGAVTGYRSKIIIEAAYFLDNQATATGSGTGFGGAIAAVSNDTQGFDGDVNRPSVSVTVRDSVFDATKSVAQMAGAIYVAGDANREFGINGVSGAPSLGANRAVVRISGTAFHNMRVTQVAGADGSGVGGAILVDLVDLHVENSAFLGNVADGLGTSDNLYSGNNGSGGALAVINRSTASVVDTVFAENVADKFGGALFLQDSHADVERCKFSDNDVHPDVNESIGISFGSAIFSSPVGASITGRVANSLFSGSRGLHIFEADQLGGSTYNDLRYDANTFWGSGFPDFVFRNWALPGAKSKTVAELNALTVDRTDLPDTDKSQTDNVAATSEPTAARLMVFPPIAVADSAVPRFVVYAWQSTAAATLNNAPLNDRSGLLPISNSAVTSYVMRVGTTTVSDSIAVLTPAAYMPMMVR